MPDYKDVPLGQIESISSVNGIITYRVAYPSKSYATRELCEETYEEALKIVQEETKAI